MCVVAFDVIGRLFGRVRTPSSVYKVTGNGKDHEFVPIQFGQQSLSPRRIDCLQPNGLH